MKHFLAFLFSAALLTGGGISSVQAAHIEIQPGQTIHVTVEAQPDCELPALDIVAP